MHFVACVFTNMLFIDEAFIAQFGIAGRVHSYLQAMKWEKFAALRFPSHRSWIIEFLTTLDYVDAKMTKLKFRHLGDEFVVGYKDMFNWFGFPKSGYVDRPADFNPNYVWRMFSGEDFFDDWSAEANDIKDDSILYFHKFLAHSLFGRVDGTIIKEKDLWVLDCSLQGRTVDSTGILFDSLYKASRSDVSMVGMGNLICGIIMGARKVLMTYAPPPTLATLNYLGRGCTNSLNLDEYDDLADWGNEDDSENRGDDVDEDLVVDVDDQLFVPPREGKRKISEYPKYTPRVNKYKDGIRSAIYKLDRFDESHAIAISMIEEAYKFVGEMRKENTNLRRELLRTFADPSPSIPPSN